MGKSCLAPVRSPITARSPTSISGGSPFIQPFVFKMDSETPIDPSSRLSIGTANALACVAAHCVASAHNKTSTAPIASHSFLALCIRRVNKFCGWGIPGFQHVKPGQPGRRAGQAQPALCEEVVVDSRQQLHGLSGARGQSRVSVDCARSCGKPRVHARRLG